MATPRTGSPHASFSKALPPGILIAVMLLVSVSRLLAQQLSVGLVPDGITLTAGIVLAGASTLLPITPLPSSFDAGAINQFDSLAYFGYSRGFAVASDVLQYATTAFPLLMAFSLDGNQAAAAGVIYVETLSLAYFARAVGKFIFPRVRPWAYFAPVDGPSPDPTEGNESFPSGHTTLAFASAAFGVTTCVLYFSDSPWCAPYIIADIGLASATAACRVLAGMHFMSDVIAGAVLGTVIGVALPLLHMTDDSSAGGKSVPMRWAVPLFSVSF